MGCLTAPFKVLGCLGLLAALLVGWLYRDRVLREAGHLRDRIEQPSAPSAPAAAVRGRPSARALSSAQAKIDSLNGWRADSVVLSPSEVASLMGQGLSPKFRKELDSLQVELLDGEVKLRGRLRTARLPREVVGPFAAALRPNEPVEAIGPLRVTGPGTGEWACARSRSATCRSPRPRFSGWSPARWTSPARETVPWPVPDGIRGMRVRPGRRRLSTELHAHEPSGPHRRRRGRHPSGAEAGARVRGAGGPGDRVGRRGDHGVLRVPAAPRLPRCEDGRPRWPRDTDPAPGSRSEGADRDDLRARHDRHRGRGDPTRGLRLPREAAGHGSPAAHGPERAGPRGAGRRERPPPGGGRQPVPDGR